MGEPAVRAMTADEFLVWEDGTDTRYELVDGAVVAMAPATDRHGTITGNACMEISLRLRQRSPCRAIVEAGIRIDGHSHYKADVAASCAEPAGHPYVEAPFLIVEVLSPSSWRDDVGAKLQRYIQLSSVREIWLIDSRERWVQVWRRADDTWIVTMPMRDGAFASEALTDRIEIEALYRNAGL